MQIFNRFINRVTPTEQRWWTEQIESRLGQRRNIDILLINSALWDINRFNQKCLHLYRNIWQNCLTFRTSPWAHLDFAGHVDEFIAGVPLSVPNQLCFWLTTPPSMVSPEKQFLLFLLTHFCCSIRGDQQQRDDDRGSGTTKFPDQIQRPQFKQGCL